MKRLNKLILALQISCLFAGVLPAKESISYKVEVINSTPILTANGLKIRPRVLWVTNNRGRQVITMEASDFKDNAGKWHCARFEFTSPADIDKAAFSVDFGKAEGEVCLENIKIIELESGELVRDISAADLGKLIEASDCASNAKLSYSENGGKDKTSKVLCAQCPDEDFVFALKDVKLKKGAKYAFIISAKCEDARPLTVYAKNPEGSEFIHVAPNFDNAADQIKLAADAGVNFVSFGIDNFWDSDGREPNYKDLAAVFNAVLRVNPKARLIPRLLMYPNRHFKWWRDLHAAHFMKDADGKSRGFVSISSELYRKQGVDTLKSFINFCEKNFREHMAGYHPGGGNSHEWFYGHSWRKEFTGYDAQTLKAWRKWLGNKYGSVEALEKAWKKSGIGNFNNVEIPTPSEREAPGHLIDPASYASIVDFNQFLQDEMAETVLLFAKTARESAGEGRLILFFYGYGFEFTRLRNGPAFSGHLALEKFIKSPYIDCLCGPISYYDRYFGEGKSTMGATESVSDAGKMWFDEDDTRTYLTPVEDPFYLGKLPNRKRRKLTQKNSIEVIRRNLSQETIRNNGVWWMDLKDQNWYNDPVLWDQMRMFKKIEKNFLKNPEPYRPEVRLVMDETSLLYIGARGASYSTVTYSLYWSRSELNRAGVPFGHYLLSDILEREEDSAAKLYIFTSAYALSSKQRERISKLKASKLWVWAPGYIDLDNGNFSLKAVEEASGFKVKLADSKIRANVISTKEGLDAGLPENFGPVDNLSVMFVPELKSGDVVLAKFSDGSPAVVARKGEGRADIFCATTAIPAALLRYAAHLSGAKVYTEQPAAVYANHSYVSVTATKDATYELNFGTDEEIIDAYSGNVIKRGPELKLDMKEGDNRLFKIGR